MPDPRIPIIAGALRDIWRVDFVVPSFETIATRIVEALDRAVPVPAADQVEIVARAAAEAVGVYPDEPSLGPSYKGSPNWMEFQQYAFRILSALSAAPRVTEVSDAMVDTVLDVFHGSRFWRKNQASQRRRMRAALSAALAGQDREVADAREIELRKAYAGLRIAWPEVHGDELDRMDAAVDAFSRLAPSSSVTAPPPAESVSDADPWMDGFICCGRLMLGQDREYREARDEYLRLKALHARSLLPTAGAGR